MVKKSKSKKATVLQKNHFSRFSVLVICVIVSAVATLLTLRIFAQAAVASIFLEPASQTITVGQNATFNIRVNSGGQPIKSARANLTYPAAQFDFVSISTAGSSFSDSGPTTGGSGNISVTRSVDDAISGGSLQLASVTLRAKAAGTGTVAPQATSQILHDDDYNIYNQSQSKSATITASSPPSNLPPVPPPVSPTTPAPSSPSSSGQPRTTSPSSNTPNTSSAQPQSSPQSQQPGDESNDTSTPEGGFYSADITILRENGEPAGNVEVEAFGQTVKTNEEGTAHFDSVSPGYHIVNVLAGSYNHTDTVQILEDGGSNQAFRMQLGDSTAVAPENNKTAAVRVVGIVLAVALAVSAAYLWWIKRGKGSEAYAQGLGNQPDPVENPRAAPLLQASPTQQAQEPPKALVTTPTTDSRTPLSQLDERNIAPFSPEAEKEKEQIALAEAAVAHALAANTDVQEKPKSPPKPAKPASKPLVKLRKLTKPKLSAETKPAPENPVKKSPVEAGDGPYLGEMKIPHDKTV